MHTLGVLHKGKIGMIVILNQRDIYFQGLVDTYEPYLANQLTVRRTRLPLSLGSRLRKPLQGNALLSFITTTKGIINFVSVACNHFNSTTPSFIDFSIVAVN